jgi:GntR family transcriptional regulator
MRAPSYLSSFTEAVEAQGRSASHRLLKFGPTEWREGLPYPEDAALVLIERLRFVDGAPAAIHRSFIDKKVASRIGLTRGVAAAPGFSLYCLCDRAGLSSSAESRPCALGPRRQVRRGCSPSPTRPSSWQCAARRLGGTALLDVVDAVYDARRYSYQAEIRRDRAAKTSSHSRKNAETNDASNSNVRRAFGPRLAPWDDRDGGSG